MAANDMLGDTKLTAKLTDLILEQLTKRLDELHVHTVRQAANVMVRLDSYGRPTGEAHALNNIRVQRTLRQELSTTKLCSFLFKDFDKQAADRLALDLGVLDASKSVEKQIRCIAMNQTYIESATECGHDFFRFPARRIPGSTKMQVSWSPIASWISLAATELSTPPDRPQITRPVPTCWRMRAISRSRKPAIVHLPSQPATP